MQVVHGRISPAYGSLLFFQALALSRTHVNVLKEQSLGTVGNTIAGLVGGGLGGQILSALGVLGGSAAGAGTQAGSFDIGSLIGNIAGSGVGGAILMSIIGVIKKAMAQ
jgi:hypothetical protein